MIAEFYHQHRRAIITMCHFAGIGYHEAVLRLAMARNRKR